MRRSVKGKKPKKYRQRSIKKSIAILIFICMFILFVLVYMRINQEIIPIVMKMAHIKADAITTQVISQAITKTFKEKNITARDLVIYDYNENGEVVSWAINTPIINEICSDISIDISNQLENIPITTLKVPLGNLTGSELLANIGPEIKVEVLPSGSAKINYDKEFRSTGINQINHTVWLNIDTNVQVVIPLSSDQIRVTRKVILVDKVLSGKVPPSYVDTTRDSIMDAELQNPFSEPQSFEYPSVN